MLTKDGKDVSLDEITIENYACPKGEELSYHAIIEIKQFDSKTGQRIGAPRLQKFGIKMWENIVYSALHRQGFDIRVVHDPKDFIEKYKAKYAELKAKQAATAKIAAEAKRKAERDAMKAELIAELKAEGLILDKKTKKE